MNPKSTTTEDDRSSPADTFDNFGIVRTRVNFAF